MENKNHATEDDEILKEVYKSFKIDLLQIPDNFSIHLVKKAISLTKQKYDKNEEKLIADAGKMAGSYIIELKQKDAEFLGFLKSLKASKSNKPIQQKIAELEKQK